jgi:XrtJ-associated TM-motif-TM protein
LPLTIQFRGLESEDTIDMKKTALAFAFTLILAAALPLRAQTGCDDSPEDPTIALALVGGAGALAANLWRSRSRKQ